MKITLMCSISINHRSHTIFCFANDSYIVTSIEMVAREGVLKSSSKLFVCFDIEITSLNYNLNTKLYNILIK